jgi:hypothetical protein
MSILIHLIEHDSGFEFSVPKPGHKGGLPLLEKGEKYTASFLFPCEFDQAVEIVKATTWVASKKEDPIAWILKTLKDHRQEVGKRGFG